MRRSTAWLSTPALVLVACAGTPAAPDATTDVTALDAATTPDVAATPDSGGPDVPPVRPPPIQRTQPEAVLAPRRQSCGFAAGAWPAETLGSDVPVGDAIPVDHVLVLMQENRSFDHYFGHLAAAGQTGVEPPPANWTNPDSDGTPVPATHDTQFCVDDPAHGWGAVHAQYNNGAMDGFVTSNNPGGARAMAYLDQSDLPFYYSLATTFAIGDRYHSSLLGPTWPNRLYLMSATSFGLTYNTFVATDLRATPVAHVFGELDAAQVAWRDYAGGARMLGFYPYYGINRRETRAHLSNLDDLMADLASGHLPSVAFIEPSYDGSGGDRYDEHPPGMPQAGEAFVERVVRALMASPAWRRTVLFITYDEHGGFADHVPPPAACPPDALPAVNLRGEPAGGHFDRLGVRVPFIVVSPYARRHFVSHTTYDHTSILRFIQSRFGLPAMTARDANATPPMDVFDFANPPFATPPTLAPAVIDAAAQARCRAAYPPGGGL